MGFDNDELLLMHFFFSFFSLLSVCVMLVLLLIFFSAVVNLFPVCAILSAFNSSDGERDDELFENVKLISDKS